MKDPKTMSYNAGYDMDLKGYDKETGTITKTDEEMITWYNNWVNKNPDKYFAYIYDSKIAEPIGEDGKCFTLRWMEDMASKYDCAITGSVAVQEGYTDGVSEPKFYNRLYFVTPHNYLQYDKHHLFTYGGEHKRYSPGKERVIAEWKGVKFLLQICYDVRFPVFSRNRLMPNIPYCPEYDAIIYVASWPETRVATWKKLLPARAIENQCYVLAVNRVGTDPACSYIGGTMVIDPLGNIAAQVSDGKEDAITAELDMAYLAKARSKFPVLEDAD